jgi:hypothetical protein
MKEKDDIELLKYVLNSASKKVAKWPLWRRSYDARKQLELLSSKKTVKKSKNDNELELTWEREASRVEIDKALKNLEPQLKKFKDLHKKKCPVCKK